MRIRLACAADARALCALNRAFNGEGVAGAEEVAESLCKNEKEIVVVAQKDGQIVGFLCAQCIHSMCYRDPVGQIAELFVLEAFRRQGAARAMMDFAHKCLAVRGVKELFLLPGRGNVAARAFYEACGYGAADEQMYEKSV